MAEIAWDLLGHQGIADLLQEVRPLCLSPEQACRKISKTTPCKVASDRKNTTLCTGRLTCRANHLQISIIAQSVAELLPVRVWLASFRCWRPARLFRTPSVLLPLHRGFWFGGPASKWQFEA